MDIIDLKPEKPDQGEIRYTYSETKIKSAAGTASVVQKTLGVLIGAGLFVLFVMFFVYVILPIIAIFLIVMFVKNLLNLSRKA